MTKAKASLTAAVLGLGLLSQQAATEAQPLTYPPDPVAWVVAEGYSGFSGIPWPGPPFAWPIRTPAYGCYLTRAHVKGAWREVEVCH
jgi:hypothetical protein